jgi:hypothetical protein
MASHYQESVIFLPVKRKLKNKVLLFNAAGHFSGLVVDESGNLKVQHVY